MTGVILKGVGGFYTVLSEGSEYVCKARGRFRKEGLTPLPGDVADFSDEGYLLGIRERRNRLARPAVANVDQLVVTIAFSKPAPDFLLADRLFVQAERCSVDSLLVINKSDAPGDVSDAAKTYAAAGYPVLICSALTGDGMGELRDRLSGKISAFAGQSAVGKSSLLNSLSPSLELKTGGLSAKTERGKHTTRHAELVPLPGGGLAVDTPGFSLLETDRMEPEDLALLYPEFRDNAPKCRFAACLHDTEPDCAVKAALEPANMPRYGRYLTILHEMIEMRKRRFD